MNSRNTKPEIKVQKLLTKMGIIFEKHRKDLAGTPDISIPSKKIQELSPIGTKDEPNFWKAFFTFFLINTFLLIGLPA